jgi:hypothetical protein
MRKLLFHILSLRDMFAGTGNTEGLCFQKTEVENVREKKKMHIMHSY